MYKKWLDQYKINIKSQFNKDKDFLIKLHDYFIETWHIRITIYTIIKFWFKLLIYWPINLMLFVWNRTMIYIWMPIITLLSVLSENSKFWKYMYNIIKKIVYFLQNFFGVITVYIFIYNFVIDTRIQIKKSIQKNTRYVIDEINSISLNEEITKLIVNTKYYTKQTIYWLKKIKKKIILLYLDWYQINYHKFRKMYYLYTRYIIYRIKIMPIKIKWYKDLWVYRIRIIYVNINYIKIKLFCKKLWMYVYIGIYTIYIGIIFIIGSIFIIILGNNIQYIINILNWSKLYIKKIINKLNKKNDKNINK